MSMDDTKDYLDMDGQPLTFTDSSIRNLNIVPLTDKYAMVVYTDVLLNLPKAFLLMVNKRNKHRVSNTFTIMNNMTDDIAVCKYDGSNILFACSCAENGEVVTKIMTVGVNVDLLTVPAVENLIITTGVTGSITTNHISNLNIRTFNDTTAALTYTELVSDGQGQYYEGYGMIRKISIDTNIVIDEPVVFNETYTANIKLLNVSYNKLILVYQQKYMGCPLMYTYVTLNNDSLQMSDKYVIDSFNRVCAMDATISGDHIYIAYRNFQENNLKILDIGTSDNTMTYITVNEPDIESISIVDTYKSVIDTIDTSILIVFNTHLGTYAIQFKGVAKTKLELTKCFVNILVLLDRYHIVYVSDNIVRNVGVNKIKHGAPLAPTADHIKARSVELNSEEPLAYCRLYTMNNGEEQDIIENGVTVQSKPAGTTWGWLTKGSTYKAYAFVPEDDIWLRSDNSPSITITLLTEEDNTKVMLYGIMEDGSKGSIPVEYPGITITSSDETVVNVGIGENFGHLLLVGTGTAIITVTRGDKETYMVVTVEEGETL